MNEKVGAKWVLMRCDEIWYQLKWDNDDRNEMRKQVLKRLKGDVWFHDLNHVISVIWIMRKKFQGNELWFKSCILVTRIMKKKMQINFHSLKSIKKKCKLCDSNQVILVTRIMKKNFEKNLMHEKDLMISIKNLNEDFNEKYFWCTCQNIFNAIIKWWCMNEWILQM